ncbi:agip48 [Agrotis ipsilon multiple nucleopolyhedrovirus]|uniref:Uncharacterized protein n=1 Tax=Agrotis ipsilon multiple nucleopolyhedrovirus TaxID=208013 RepID=B6D5W2_9ABAC|nr:agip48 [Agrotis ipsilon multiple nucleopolyhedrovirus]ACI28750.1 unknown [Agrotis ipsilon multiple nucleopolyhedrovirus]
MKTTSKLLCKIYYNYIFVENTIVIVDSIHVHVFKNITFDENAVVVVETTSHNFDVKNIFNKPFKRIIMCFSPTV